MNMEQIKHNLVQISHLQEQEKERGKQILLKIMNNIIENPNEVKYQNLNLKRIKEKISNSLPFIKLLENAGFFKSNCNERLLFNKSKLKQLEMMHQMMVQMISNNESSAIQWIELMEKSMNDDMNDTTNQSPNENVKSNDSKNMRKLKEMTAKIMDIKPCKIDSDYLLDGDNIYDSQYQECEIKDCQILMRISNILQKYHLFVEKQENIKIENIYASNNYSNINLLNDFNHLLSVHSDLNAFEYIYNVLMAESNKNKPCEMTSCLSMRRNQRNRLIEDRKLYFNDNNVIKQQFLDKIHSYFFHSFDCVHRISQKDQENIFLNKLNEECMKNEDDEKKDIDESIDYRLFDINVESINKFIKTKQKTYSNVAELHRLNGKYNKYQIEMNEEYSFGVRYFYWKNNDEYTLNDWYIMAKYMNLKDELLNNEICSISQSIWYILELKANEYFQTNKVREIYCPRKDSAKYYEMQYGEQMSINHLIAIMIYCNFDVLQYKFTETFRRISATETCYEMKRRHSNYYYLGRLLRECVECFGMKWNGKLKISLYHGVNKQFIFKSMNGYIKGPLSTTPYFAVALNFCGDNGMLLNVEISSIKWAINDGMSMNTMNRLCCFDCDWISDYPSEHEIFCIGGLNSFRFRTIIQVSNNINYYKYIRGITQITDCITNVDVGHKNIALTSEEKQMIFRLLSHEIYRCFPNHPNGDEFKECPDYIKRILHCHCNHIQQIVFNNGCGLIHQYLFKYDNEWIKLHLLLTLFPSTNYIFYDAVKKDIIFLKQTFIYNSILKYLRKSSKYTNLQRIVIAFNHKYLQDMDIYIQSFNAMFSKYSWNICIAQETYGMNGCNAFLYFNSL